MSDKLQRGPFTIDPARYPAARLSDTADTYHGTIVPDPYRWIEAADSRETQEWADAQNALTDEVIRSIPAVEQLSARMTELWDYPRYGLPWKRGGRYFFSKNDGLQNHAVFFWQEGLNGEPKVLLDPNEFSEDGSVALMGLSITRDGKLAAYQKSESGSDNTLIMVRDIDSGQDLEDVIRFCRFTSVAWIKGNGGFFYSRFPDPAAAPPEEVSRNNQVFFHRLGAPQEQDTPVFYRPDEKEWLYEASITQDQQYLVLYIGKGTDTQNRFYYREADSDGEFVRLLDDNDASYRFIGNVGPVFYFQTDLAAPKRRVIAIDVARPGREHWREVIAKGDDLIEWVKIINHQLVVLRQHHAHHLLFIHELDGKFVREIPLPAIGSVIDITGEQADEEMFVGLSSFTFPPTIYQYAFRTGALTVHRAPEIKFNPEEYETKQFFATSRDGTKVPLFVTHRRGLALDGDNPTLVTGYGGFNVGITPYFSVTQLVWIETGAVLVETNLRGGNEYGEEWHKAGMLENKQNVFDDFIAVCEWLIDNGYTRRERLAIYGGSNGGLLVAACMIQRPDLFGAMLCMVPVIDMLRYHLYGIGHFWTGEYGNAEQNPDHFNFLYAYSPLHNVKPGTAYPASLIVTADHDDRVEPGHAKKFAAALQAAQAGNAPLLLRVESKTGHGHGKPVLKLIREMAEYYAFILRALGKA